MTIRYKKHIYLKDNIAIDVSGLNTVATKVVGDKLYHLMISRLPGEVDNPDPQYRLAIIGEDESGEWGALYSGNRAEITRLVEHHTSRDGGNLGRWEMYATIPELAKRLPWDPWAPNIQEIVDEFEHVDIDPDNYLIPHREPKEVFMGYGIWAAIQGWGAEDPTKQQFNAELMAKSLMALY